MSRRFPVFPGAISNSGSFRGFPGVADTLPPSAAAARIKPRLANKSAKLGSLVFEICKWTDTQTS